MATTGASLAAATLHSGRRALLDAYGVMLAATGLSDDVAPYRRLAQDERGTVRLIGDRSHRSSIAAAAMANGALAHALDFGDTFDAGPAHPNAALVPALLALADARPDTSLRDLLTALVLGSDLACRLSLAPARPFEDGGWYPPPLVNQVAGAAACARFLGLDRDGIRHALGLALLAGAFPGEIKYDPTSPVRGVREAFAARGAVEAARLAAAGATAFAAPLEGQAGFFAVYAGGPPTAALTDRLGERFLGEEVSFKPWPSCRGTHPYIEAALRLRDRVDRADISRIEAETGPIQAMLMRSEVESAVAAKFSIPFTVATALVHGEVTLTSFSAERLADPRVAALARKVVERRNPAWGRAEAASGSLTVQLATGGESSERVAQALGHPERPLSDADLTAKFVACAGHAAAPWPAAHARAVAERILTAGPAEPVDAIIVDPDDRPNS